MSNRQISEITKTLIRTKEILNNPDNWTQGAYARYGDSFCLLGGLAKANGWDTRIAYCAFCYIAHMQLNNPLLSARRILRKTILESEHHKFLVLDPTIAISFYNDDPARKHTEILDMLDKAISKSIQEDNK